MIIIITDGIAHTSERGPGTRSELHKSEFSLPSLLPAGSQGTQAFRPPAAPPRRPSQRPPFILRAQSGAFTGVPRASRPRPPPAARHWLPPLPVRPGVLPTTAPPGSALRRRSFPTAGTLRQLLIGPARQPLLLIGENIPHRRGRILSQRGPIGPCRAHVGGALLMGPPLFLPRPKPQDGPGSR